MISESYKNNNKRRVMQYIHGIQDSCSSSVYLFLPLHLKSIKASVQMSDNHSPKYEQGQQICTSLTCQHFSPFEC